MTAWYMGMFIPWRAERLRVEWSAKQKDAGTNSTPSLILNGGRVILLVALKKWRPITDNIIWMI